jgi:hypothetical protein
MNNDISSLIDNLKQNGFHVELYKNVTEVKKVILGKIDMNETIGIGGSMTIFDMNIYNDLKERGNVVYWHWMVPDNMKDEERAKASHSDVYLSSTNAITLDGKLVNIDGAGNRVSSMFYGHKKVFIVAGINKLCKDYDEAIKRIKSIACPKNAERLKLNTPCRFTGKCNDCSSPDRICNVEVIMHKKPKNIDICIYIVEENLGY